MQNQSSNTELYNILSWACLVVGWFLGLSIFAFPLGMHLAGKVIDSGGDAHLIRTLNKWSLVITLIFIIFFFLMSIFGMMMF